MSSISQTLQNLSGTLLALVPLLPGTIVTIGTLLVTIIILVIGTVQPHLPHKKLETLSAYLKKVEEMMRDLQLDGLLPDPQFVGTLELSLNRYARRYRQGVACLIDLLYRVKLDTSRLRVEYIQSTSASWKDHLRSTKNLSFSAHHCYTQARDLHSLITVYPFHACIYAKCRSEPVFLIDHG